MSRYGVDNTAPLPLGHFRALERGVELRLSDPTVYSWRTISAVMAEYHGFSRSPWWWQKQLRGKVPERCNGRPFPRAA